MIRIAGQARASIGGLGGWLGGGLGGWLVAALLAASTGACAAVDLNHADATRALTPEPYGQPVMSMRWRWVTADRVREVKPQEFASAAVDHDTAYLGSETGTFFALRLRDGHLRWRAPLGSVSTAPLVSWPDLYVGTDDGELIKVDAQTGKVAWRYASRGPIERTPIELGGLIIFANEADQVYAVDAHTGAFKWQYKSETPDEYTLRGHAGLAVDGELVYTGFANGSMVALRASTGSVAWLTSLKGDADKFTDVDATPVVVGATVYATSSSGGVYALDKATGLVRWHLPLFEGANPGQPPGNVGGLATDGKHLYVTAAEQGVYALDLNGNILWRQGTAGAGEPAEPLVSGDLLFYTLADAGLFVADKRTGEVFQYFDPGEGISGVPTVTPDDQVLVLSNRGILYALALDRE